MKRALLALAAVVAALATPTVALAAPFVERYTDNPVTAEPPVSRPGGPHCTVTLADPAIHTFNLYAEQVDITPFAGLLVDGGTHELTASVQNAGDEWTVVATLLLYTDHH